MTTDSCDDGILTDGRWTTPHLSLTTISEEETRHLGRLLGERLTIGDVICLSGDLGAGKTRFAQGIGDGLEVLGHMSSPTFAFINEHQGRLPLMHADLYRVEDAAELDDIGLEEYLYGDWVSVVEWAERAQGRLPADRLHVVIRCPEGGDARSVDLFPYGQRAQRLCEVYEHVVAGN